MFAPSPEIEELGKLLIQYVRDEAIQFGDRRPSLVNNEVDIRWRNAARHGESMATVLIPDMVDITIYYLLNAIDSGVIQLSFKTSDGKVVDLTKNAWLAGWYIDGDPEGWRASHSRERYFQSF